MRPLLGLLALTALLAAQDEAATVIDTTKRSGIQCQLLRGGDGPAAYAVRFANRSGRGVRIDYRALSRTVSTWTGTVILRPSEEAVTMPLPVGGDYFGADLMTVTPGTVRETVETRTAADGTTQRITVLELIDDGAVARDQARATAVQDETQALKAQVAALRRERQEAEDAAARAEQAARDAADAARRAEDNRYRSDLVIIQPYPLYPLHRRRPPTPVAPPPAPKREQTWEEFRDQELANERKVWKNF